MAREPLHILVADGNPQRLRQVSSVLAGLGHETFMELEIDELGPITAAHNPDAAVVVPGESSIATLEKIGRIVREAACPVIAVIDVEDPEFIKEAAQRGIFAYVLASDDSREMESSLDIVLRRFAEYHALEGAFGRRALTERAKGVLMERHHIDEQAAFNMLRSEARRTNRKVIDLAEAILASHVLLPAEHIEADIEPESSSGEERFDPV